MNAPDRAEQPALVVRRGRPTDEELAALVIALAAVATPAAVPAPEPGRASWVRPPGYRPAGAWNGR